MVSYLLQNNPFSLLNFFIKNFWRQYICSCFPLQFLSDTPHLRTHNFTFFLFLFLFKIIKTNKTENQSHIQHHALLETATQTVGLLPNTGSLYGNSVLYSGVPYITLYLCSVSPAGHPEKMLLQRWTPGNVVRVIRGCRTWAQWLRQQWGHAVNVSHTGSRVFISQ